MLDYYLEDLLPVHLAEFLAAISGSYYLAKHPGAKPATKLFVYFLWITFWVEIIGLYTTYAYFTNYKNLEFLENSPFERNYWLYNIYNIFSYLTYFTFFILNLESKKLKRALIVLAFFFAGTATINLIFSGIFFMAFSAYTHIIGTIIILLCISAYYYEMLSSERILKFYKDLVFYISVGALVFHLSSTPLFIYSKYFTMQSPDFVDLYGLTLKTVNLLLYGIIILGFIVCAPRRQKAVA